MIVTKLVKISWSLPAFRLIWQYNRLGLLFCSLFTLCWPFAPQAANSPITAAYDLRDIHNRQSMLQFIDDICQTGAPTRMGLVRMLMPPAALLSDHSYRCPIPSNPVYRDLRQALTIPTDVLSTEDEQWLYKTHQLMQENTYSLMSEWIRPKDPRDISFLHRAFATRPYLTARIMAAAPAPHVGAVWQLLAQHMDRILSASADTEDRRLLAYAMARDGREQAALAVIDTLLQQGDALALRVLPYLSLDLPQPQDDEMADTTEPQLGYQLVPMLEQYLYLQHYPASFCEWAATVKEQPLQYYVEMTLTNAADMLQCP